MRRWMLLAGYCVPYAYLAIWGDALHGTVLFYALMVTALFLLCRGSEMHTVLLGNLLSLVASGLCLAAFGPADMAVYFKPFTAWSLMLVISLTAAAVQVGYSWRKTNGRK